MRAQGRLTEWNDDRGFGFIAPLDGSHRVFAHISEFPRDKRRPLALDLVTYEVERDERSRPRAVAIQFLTPTRARGQSSALSAAGGRHADLLAPLAVSVTMLLVLLMLVALGQAPASVLLLYTLMSLAAFAAYGWDKDSAQRGRWRTSEATLLLIGFLGGWPGALVAQRVFHHKTQKESFQVVFWFTVVANCAVLAWFVFQSPAVG